jgi:hypothetical protein
LCILELCQPPWHTRETKTVSASPLRRGRFLSPPSHDDACTKKPRTMPGLQRCWREDQYLAATGAPNGLNFTDTLARMRSSSPPMLRPLIPSRAKASAEDAWKAVSIHICWYCADDHVSEATLPGDVVKTNACISAVMRPTVREVKLHTGGGGENVG